MSPKILDISEKDYRALPIESFSSIKHLLKGPKYYFDMKARPFKGSTATDFGTAIHHLIQGHKEWVGFKNKTNKEKYTEYETEFQATCNNEGIILQESYKPKFEAIEKNLQDTPKIVELVKKFQYELAYEIEYDGIPIKGRVDGVNEIKHINGWGEPTIETLEIKSYGQGNGLEEIRKIFTSRDYDMQAYIYSLMTGSKKHWMLHVGTSEPFSVGLNPCSDTFLESGKRKLEIAAFRYKKYVINKEPYESEYEEL